MSAAGVNAPVFVKNWDLSCSTQLRRAAKDLQGVKNQRRVYEVRTDYMIKLCSKYSEARCLESNLMK